MILFAEREAGSDEGWEEGEDIPIEVQRIADRETAAKLRVSFMTQVKMAGGKGCLTKDTFCKFKF